MASKTKVTPQKEEMRDKEGPETPPDSPPARPVERLREGADPRRQEAWLRHP
jgi:hypothetical protein